MVVSAYLENKSRYCNIPIALKHLLCSTMDRGGPDRQGSGMHCRRFSVQGSCLVFCGADEDTGKSRTDTCNLTASLIYFRGMADRCHKNTHLIRQG